MYAEVTYFAPYMKEVMRKLEMDKKRPAVHTYNATLNSFMKFARSGEEAINKNEEVPVNERMPTSRIKEMKLSVADVFTIGKLKEYEIWLRNNEAKWNTVSTYMRTLKAVYNRLVGEQRVDYNAKLFDDVYTKVESQTKRALTEGQVNMLLHADLEELPEGQQCALAYFLLMLLFRGMPFIDFANLRKQDVKGNCITYCRHKTGRKIVVRVPKEAVALLEKFRSKETGFGYLFPILDDTVKKEKEVYALYRKMLRDFNHKLTKIAALLLPGVKMSSYTARHTWATLAFYAGVPVGIISKALGHSSIKVTETYLKPFENEKVDEANDKLIMTLVKNGETKKVA